MLDFQTLASKYDFDNPNQLLGCEFDKYLGFLPAHAYVQNSRGIYLWCNAKQATTLSLSASAEICGKTIFDLCSEDTALKVFENDQQVMEQRESQNFKEQALFCSGVKMLVTSSKKPIYNAEGAVIGMFGISINIPNPVINTKDAITKLKQHGLTMREAESAYYLVRGKTAKEAAKLMAISYRTVEKHIENTRVKLGLNRRSQLFDFIHDVIY